MPLYSLIIISWKNSEVSNNVRLFGGNKVGNLIF
jgi:hypothetical protein